MTAATHDGMLLASLKMYFGHQQTVEWAAAVSDIVARSRAELDFRGEVAVFPDFTSLSDVRELLRSGRIGLGAQDVASDDGGAQTGEVSAAVLAELGCTFVEIGHAERRQRFGESDDVISRKVANAVGAGLVPLICVGELEPDHADAAEFCRTQLESALGRLRESEARTRIVVAYEPVWAIGASDAASPDHVGHVVAELRRAAAAHPAVDRAQVIYGGSAGPDTVAGMMSRTDGLFLGRFVHDPEAFGRVIEAQAATTTKAENA